MAGTVHLNTIIISLHNSCVLKCPECFTKSGVRVGREEVQHEKARFNKGFKEHLIKGTRCIYNEKEIVVGMCIYSKHLC